LVRCPNFVLILLSKGSVLKTDTNTDKNTYKIWTTKIWTKFGQAKIWTMQFHSKHSQKKRIWTKKIGQNLDKIWTPTTSHILRFERNLDKICPNFGELSKVCQNFGELSKFCPNFGVLSKFYPNFCEVSKFCRNFCEVSKVCPNFVVQRLHGNFYTSVGYMRMATCYMGCQTM